MRLARYWQIDRPGDAVGLWVDDDLLVLVRQVLTQRMVGRVPYRDLGRAGQVDLLQDLQRAGVDDGDAVAVAVGDEDLFVIGVVGDRIAALLGGRNDVGLGVAVGVVDVERIIDLIRDERAIQLGGQRQPVGAAPGTLRVLGVGQARDLGDGGKRLGVEHVERAVGCVGQVQTVRGRIDLHHIPAA